MMKIKLLVAFILVFPFIACNHASEREQKIDKIEISFNTVRFDRLFAEATPKTLPGLQKKYPFLFPKQYSDSVWIAKLTDTLQNEINTEVSKAFPNIQNTKEELHSLFQHIKYYFPKFKIPEVITITSDVDYKHKAIYTGDYLFIALDTYLGEDHDFYIGVVEYFKKNFKKDQIVPDVAANIAKQYVPKPKSRTFLAHMVYFGKQLYLKDRWLPEETNWRKMGYTEEEWNFAEKNEEMIWRYFVDNEVIFDTDSDLQPRFLYPAPFSKFYLSLDAKTPDRLGQYIGWQMVNAYMDKNDVSLQELLKTDAETIFNNANYKPNK